MLLLLFMIIILLFFPLLFSLPHFLLPAKKKKRGFESRILEACLLGARPRIGLLRGQSSACPQSADNGRTPTHIPPQEHRW